MKQPRAIGRNSVGVDNVDLSSSQVFLLNGRVLSKLKIDGN